MTSPPATGVNQASPESVGDLFASMGGKFSDEDRIRWESSSEHKKFVKNKTVILAIGGVLFVVGVLLITLGGESSDYNLNFLAGGGLILLGDLIGVPYCLYQSALFHKNRFKSNSLLEFAHDRDAKLAASAVDGKLELVSLWSNTQDRLSTYHSIATMQSEESFKTGKRFAIGGFFVIILAGIGAILAPNTAGSIAAGAIGIVGAAMSSYIGATFMKSQSEASAQLRDFFNQPVEFSRVLSIERLIETLEEGDRPAAVHAVINSMMPGAPKS